MRELFGIRTPGPDADEEDLVEFLSAHPPLFMPGLGGEPWISGQHHELAATFLRNRHALAFDVRNVDQSTFTGIGGGVDGVLEVLRGRFDAKATREALETCYRDPPAVSCGPPFLEKMVVETIQPGEFNTQINLQDAQKLAARGKLLGITGNPPAADEIELGMSVYEQIGRAADVAPVLEKYRGILFHAWGTTGGDLRDRLKPPAFDRHGRGGRIAVQDKYVFYSVKTSGMEGLIDASQGKRPSLADAEEFRLLARGMSALGAYNAWFTDRVDLTKANDGIDQEVQGPPLLRPYFAVSIGGGKDDEGSYSALVLVHSDSKLATENVDRLRRRIDASTSSIPVDVIEIRVEGQSLLTKLRGNWGLLMTGLVSGDYLFLHE